MSGHKHECSEAPDGLRCADRGYCECSCGHRSTDGGETWYAANDPRQPIPPPLPVIIPDVDGWGEKPTPKTLKFRRGKLPPEDVEK